MKISMIAAVASNRTIGRHNDLPWKIRDDMRFFVRMTRGHSVITGRKNYDAMRGALPKRNNYVVTRQRDYQPPDATACSSVEEALALAEATGETEAFVIGGAEIYALAFPYAHTFYRTRVLADVAGDTLFPEFDEGEWTVTVLERGDQNEHNEHPFIVERLDRTTAPKPLPERW